MPYTSEAKLRELMLSNTISRAAAFEISTILQSRAESADARDVLAGLKDDPRVYRIRRAPGSDYMDASITIEMHARCGFADSAELSALANNALKDAGIFSVRAHIRHPYHGWNIHAV